MKGVELIRLLKANGWEQVRQKGSHHQFRHPNKKEVLTVSFHKESDEIPKGLASKLKKMAGI